MSLPIPTIDFDPGPEHPTVVNGIRSACENWGFFQLKGHGMDPRLRNDLFQLMSHFFALSLSDKQTFARTPDNFWGFYDRELTRNVRDWKEIFDLDANPAHFHGSGHEMPTPWPAALLPDFKPVVGAWLNQCELLGNQLMESICLGLGQTATRLADAFGDDHTSFLRLNYYPVYHATHRENKKVTDLPLGINHHTDAGALTILAQDEVPALQVHHENQWHTVYPEPGALIINIGDMVQVWSNDRFRAAEHRVMSSTSKARYSAPYFFNPRYDCRVSPITDNEDVRYKPVPWDEFRSGRAAGDYADVGEEIQISWYRL